MLCMGTTVFCRTWNFEPSCRVCPFPWKSCIFTECFWIW